MTRYLYHRCPARGRSVRWADADVCAGSWIRGFGDGTRDAWVGSRAMLEAMLDLQNLAPERLRPIKRVEYERMVQAGLFAREHIELLDGFLVVMTPIGAPHATIVDRLGRIFIIALDRRAHVRIQGPFAASDQSEPEPDLAVYPLGSYMREHPSNALLIIEVADSSLAADRHIKTPLYARAGVPEYWIVDVEGRAIEVHSDPAAGVYRSVIRHELGRCVAPAAFPDVVVDIAALLEP